MLIYSLKVGILFCLIAAVRAEGVSVHFCQRSCLPTFRSKICESNPRLKHGHEYRTGTIHSTDYRFWEFDDSFKENLIEKSSACRRDGNCGNHLPVVLSVKSI